MNVLSHTWLHEIFYRVWRIFGLVKLKNKTILVFWWLQQFDFILHDFHFSLCLSDAGECFEMIALAIVWVLDCIGFHFCMFCETLCMRMICEEFV